MSDEKLPVNEEIERIRKDIKDLLADPDFSHTRPEPVEKFDWETFHAEQDVLIPQTERDVALYAFGDTLKSLLESHPELSIGLGKMDVLVSNRTGSIATNNTTLWINPSWWAKKSPRELRHCAAFAALSIIYDSIERGKAIPEVDHYRWELACNLIINRTLIDEGIGVMPAEGALITSITTQMTSEEVYSRLLTMSDREMTRAIWPLSFGAMVADLELSLDELEEQDELEETQPE